MARNVINPTRHFASCGVNNITCFQHVHRTLKVSFLYYVAPLSQRIKHYPKSVRLHKVTMNTHPSYRIPAVPCRGQQAYDMKTHLLMHDFCPRRPIGDKPEGSPLFLIRESSALFLTFLLHSSKNARSILVQYWFNIEGALNGIWRSVVRHTEQQSHASDCQVSPFRNTGAPPARKESGAQLWAKKCLLFT